MRLVLVHDWLVAMRGGEKCLEPFCRRFPHARLLTLLARRGSTSPAIEAVETRTSFLQHLPGVARIYRYLLPLMPWAVESLAVPRDAELVLSFSHAVAKGVRVPRGVPHVCYCFTPMRYAWHLEQHYFVPNVPIRQNIVSRAARSAIAQLRRVLLARVRAWDQRTHARVTHFVAASQTVAQRIAECYGRTSEVVYPPVDTTFYTPAATERQDYYLCVSALVPYKRIDLAIAAANRTGRRLVVIGAGPLAARYARMAGPTVELLGWQSNAEIRHHLRHCRALLFPGLEDFGIVPVEAQACGTPVIALGQGGVCETVLPASASQQGTGVWFDEQSVESLTAAIEWFEANPSACSRSLARQQAERFSAGRYEQEMLDVLARAA